METAIGLIVIGLVLVFVLALYMARRQALAAAERAAVSLAVVEAAARIPQPTPSSLGRTCSNCAHFDLDEGQGVMRTYPAFMAAASFLRPVEMGVEVDAEGNPIARDVPAKAEWAQFGYCGLRDEVLWGPMDAERRKRSLPVLPALGEEDCFE